MSALRWFVSATSAKVARLVPEGCVPKGPGYLLEAPTKEAALSRVKAYRRGEAWTLDLVIEVVW